MSHDSHLGRSYFALLFLFVVYIPDFNSVVCTATHEELHFSRGEAYILNALSMTLKGC
jgi:hypothetical protein